MAGVWMMINLVWHKVARLLPVKRFNTEYLQLPTLTQSAGIARIPIDRIRLVQKKALAALLLLVAGLALTFAKKHRWNTFTRLSQYNYTDTESIYIEGQSIVVPGRADVAVLRPFWLDLQDIFEVNSPSPREIKRWRQTPPAPKPEDLDKFIKITNVQAEETRNAHRNLTNNLPSYLNNVFSGTGIVVMGGSTYSQYATTGLRMLKKVGSKLPVEIWMKDSSEETEGLCDEFAEMEGIACRKLSDYIDFTQTPQLEQHPYSWKIFTILFSSFKDILFLDADNMALHNPDSLFESKMYKEFGAVLWPDFWQHTGSPWLPYITGLSSSKSTMLQKTGTVESGEVMWDKRRHWKSLLLATYYNYHGANYYYMMQNNGWAGWGDKETFPTALRATQEPFYKVPYHVSVMSLRNEAHDGAGMLQADPTDKSQTPRPMFAHIQIYKPSLHNMLCTDACKAFPGQNYYAAYNDPNSAMYPLLANRTRLFSVPNDWTQHADIELMLWDCLLQTACLSRVLGSELLCERAKGWICSAFGHDSYNWTIPF